MNTEDKIEFTLIGFLVGLTIGISISFYLLKHQINEIRINSDYQLEQCKYLYDEINRTERRIKYGLIKEK